MTFAVTSFLVLNTYAEIFVNFTDHFFYDLEMEFKVKLGVHYSYRGGQRLFCLNFLSAFLCDNFASHSYDHILVSIYQVLVSYI